MPILLPQNIQFDLLDKNHSQRQMTEDYIFKKYQQAYGAEISHFLPELIAIRDSEQTLIAALGLGFAQHSPLFLEQYFQSPIETLLSQTYQQAIQRQDIVEIGNLAAQSRGNIRWLIILMTAYLYARNLSWIVFTTTPALLNAFYKIGFCQQLRILAPADPKCLGQQQAQWGRYYDSKPVVVAGNIRQGFHYLSSIFLSLVWSHAYHLGYQQRC